MMGGVAVGAQGLRPAGNGDQQRGLRRFQGFRRHPEPGQGARSHPFQVAAIGGERQPDIQHALLAEPGLQLYRSGHLDQLGWQRARAGFQQAGGLHG